MNEIGFLTPDRNAEKMPNGLEDLAERGNVPGGTAEGNRIMRKLLLTCGLIAAAWIVPSVVSAQNRNNNNTGSGNSGFGSTGSSGFGSTGSSGFGSTGSSGLGGTSGFGATGGSGFGSTGLGGQGANGQTGFGGQNQLGGNASNGGILGRNTNQNGILGRNTQNQGVGGNNNLGGGGRGGGGNRGNGNNGLNAQNGGGGNSGNANQTPLVRPRLEVAFDYPRPKTDAIQITLETRLTKLSVKSPGLKSVTVAVADKGEVVLRGEVGSEAESKLAEISLRIEPGVRTIRNELTFPVAATPDE